MLDANQLNTSHTAGMPAQPSKPLIFSFIASCLVLSPSPLILALTTSSPHLHTLILPTICSPTLPAQLGLGRHRSAAKASLNSLPENEVSGLGKQRSQAADNLSLPGQLQTGLASLSWWSSRALSRRRPRVAFLWLVISVLVVPLLACPAPSTGSAQTPSTTAPR